MVEGLSSALNGGALNITIPAAERDVAAFDRTEVVDDKTLDYILYRGAGPPPP